MRSLIIPALAGAVALAGCTTNPYTGERQVSKAAWGAGIGAATGAAIGYSTGDNKKERKSAALKGAAIGGVTGGGVGAYMDYQEKKLRDRLAGVGVGIQKDKQTGAITLIMPGNITFPTNQSSIRADFYPVLDAVGDVLKEYNKTSISVSGHTDNVGRDDYNMQLSQDRASSVAQYLISRGVAGGRIQATGFGKSSPIADNSTEAGRAQNRRVEIRINPPASV
ncbi:MAG: OmpA family protein [Moraxellaceae bacterium]|jgi:outer membrane protein OmpA-like peptidoglycan-associated protein|nr:OmpA family protein [Moraxellaceae bacterium]MDF3032001.1 OmpA family protein [Moraxellaceae bacterium]